MLIYTLSKPHSPLRCGSYRIAVRLYPAVGLKSNLLALSKVRVC